MKVYEVRLSVKVVHRDTPGLLIIAHLCHHRQSFRLRRYGLELTSTVGNGTSIMHIILVLPRIVQIESILVESFIFELFRRRWV